MRKEWSEGEERQRRRVRNELGLGFIKKRDFRLVQGRQVGSIAFLKYNRQGIQPTLLPTCKAWGTKAPTQKFEKVKKTKK